MSDENNEINQAMQDVIEILDNIHAEQKDVVEKLNSLPTKEELFNNSETVAEAIKSVERSLQSQELEIKSMQLKIEKAKNPSKTIYYVFFISIGILFILTGFLYYYSYFKVPIK